MNERVYPKPHPLGGCTETTPGTLAIRGTLTREPVDPWHTGHYGAITTWLDSQVEGGRQEVIFDIDSPGGDVSGLSLLCHHIRDAPIKIKAIVTGTCASAAYCIASACDVIEAYDDSVIGSIGAYFLTPPPPEGVHISALTPLKLQGGEDVQRVADDNGIRFLQDVAAFRRLSGGLEEIAERCGKGALFTPQEALKRGLIDIIISSKGQMNMTLHEEETKEEVVEEVKEEVKDEAPEDPQIAALIDALIPKIADMVSSMIEAKLAPPEEETVTEETTTEEVTEGGAKSSCDRAARADVKRLTFALLRRDGAFVSDDDEQRASRLYDRDRGLFKEYYEEGAAKVLRRYSSTSSLQGGMMTEEQLEKKIDAYLGKHKGVGYKAARKAVQEGKR